MTEVGGSVTFVVVGVTFVVVGVEQLVAAGRALVTEVSTVALPLGEMVTADTPTESLDSSHQ